MKKIPFVNLRMQYERIRSEIDFSIAQVLEQNSFIGVDNPFVTHFEQAFSDFLGVKHVVSCANGTDSLEILLKAFGIGTGDEVIVPAISWISTSEAVSTVGAKPVFVDVDPIYYTINPSKIEEVVSSRTKAIIPVHLYGQPADMDPILEVASIYKLIVIEDCAQAHGAMYKGKMVGTIGHGSSFSFYPGKNLGAYGDAGAMITNDSHIADLCRMIANHGQKGKHNHILEGRNSRLDGLQAAVLSAKLPHLQAWTDQRKLNAQYYNSLLKHPDIHSPQLNEYSEHVFHLYVLQVPDRNQLLNSLKKKGIEAAIHYPVALPFLPCYIRNNYTFSDFPVASELQNKVISLPMYAELASEDIYYVCEQIIHSI